MTRHARRRTVGADLLPDGAPPGYRAGVRSQDPYSHRQAGYDAPQLEQDPGARPLVTSPLSVCAIVDRYAGLVGQIAGGEMMLHHLLRDSAARGHDVTVVTATPQPYTIDGVDVVPRAELNLYAPDADVILGHLMWTRLAVETAGRQGTPSVYLVHNDQQLRHWKLTPRNVTSVVWNSRWVHDLRAPAWGGPGEIIPPPVFVDDYRIDDRDPWTAPYVTLVNCNPEKGGPVLHHLAKRPPARRYLGVAGGYGEQMRPTRDTPAITWQPQTSDMVGDVYRNTRVLIMPSQYESWGRVAVEGMASGIPVVASPTPGLREALGDAAIYVPWDDLPGWERALGQLDEVSTYRRWSERARARADELSARSLLDLGRWDRMLREAAGARPREGQEVQLPGSDQATRVPSPA